MRLGRFLLWFFKPLFYLIFPYKAIGKENIPPFSPDDRLIICANHISDIDPVYLEMCQKRHVFFMAKAELFSKKIGAWFFGKQLGAFPVKRGAGDTALSTGPGKSSIPAVCWASSRKAPVPGTASWEERNPARR